MSKRCYCYFSSGRNILLISPENTHVELAYCSQNLTSVNWVCDCESTEMRTSSLKKKHKTSLWICGSFHKHPIEVWAFVEVYAWSFINNLSCYYNHFFDNKMHLNPMKLNLVTNNRLWIASLPLANLFLFPISRYGFFKQYYHNFLTS